MLSRCRVAMGLGLARIVTIEGGPSQWEDRAWKNK